jgi:hypothetical protein
MRKVLLLVVFFYLVIPASAQLDTESVPPELDQRDLYARASASRVVVVGTVISSEGVLPRLLPGQPSRWQSKDGKDLRASLYTVRVEETICRQSDFEGAAPDVNNRPQPFYLFIPFDESDLPAGDFREEIIPGQRFLLLLHELDAHALTVQYELDPNRIYYRGEGHNRGVIPFQPRTLLSQGQTPPDVIDKFRKLCTAMRPPKFEDKLALLQQLVDSQDPVLQKEAEIAKSAIKARMAHQESTPKSQ